MKATLIATAILIMGMVPSDTAQTERRPLAYVQRFKPQVEIINQPRSEKAERGGPLYSGDTLRTGSKGYALIQFMDKSLTRVKPNSMLVVQGEVKNKNNTPVRIGLKAGEIFLNVSKRTNSNFQVVTPGSIASVKGTRFGARDDNYFWVEEGAVEIQSPDSKQSQLLTQNMYGRVQDDGQIESGKLSGRKIKELSKDYDELDKKVSPNTIRLRFRDNKGEIREVELEFFDN